MLNVARLRVLREVALRGSFSRAADALSYTQSAVSQAVATLEAETEAQLVVRDRRGLRLTAAGETLVAHADAILARIAAAEADMSAILGVSGGLLRIASFPTAGATLMPLAIARFRAAHADVELTLAEGEPEEIAPRLRAGEFDLALLFEFQRSRETLGPGLTRVDLVEDPLHLALPRDHPLADRETVGLADLDGEAWVQTSAASPCARHVVRACHRAGFEPAVSFESDDYQTVQGLVAAGVGVALIPQLALSNVRPDITVRALDSGSPVRRVVAATAAGSPATLAAATMLGLLRGVTRQYAGEQAATAAGVRGRLS
jgi:DNA-binding transcriptional LysR family regulator